MPFSVLYRPTFVSLCLLSTTLSTSAAAPQPSSFTYQGRLTAAGVPVESTVIATFRLFDAETGGKQVGADLIRSVSPIDGLFTESLDFGAAPFASGMALWLEIEIDGDVLPRQQISGAPYSLSTRGLIVSDTGLRLGVGDPNNFDPFGPETELHIRGANATAFVQSNGKASMRFMSDFQFVSELYAPMNSNDLRFGHEATGDVMSITESGAVGIGTIAPQAWLDVRSSVSEGTGLRVDNTGSGVSIGIESLTPTGFAIRGTATGNDSFGVYGEAQGANSWSMFSNGRFAATGTKSFCIDHPLDPANAYLLHYSSEAPEPLNTYGGTVWLDAQGSAVVTLPNYYEAININHRYQLTAIGAPAPSLHVSEKIRGNTFTIAGGPPGLEVSWSVVGVRNDAFVRQRGAPTEVQKPVSERGRYLIPELYAQPSSRGVFSTHGQ